MIYNVTSSFTRITETAGTIQNNSYIYPIEVSNQAVADSGILLYPLNKFSFSGTQLYLRCIESDKEAEVRVVPFEAAVLRGGDAVDAITAGAFQSLQTTGSTVNFRNGSGTVVDSFSFADIAFIGSASSTVEGAFWLED